MAKVTYPRTIKFTIKGRNGSKHTVKYNTQQYKVGVYCIANGDPSTQMNLTPQQVRYQVNELKTEEQKGNIEDLELGPEITVTDESGLWEEVTNG